MVCRRAGIPRERERRGAFNGSGKHPFLRQYQSPCFWCFPAGLGLDRGISHLPGLSLSTRESGAIAVNRVNALYASNRTDYQKYALQEVSRKKPPVETAVVTMSDRVTLSPEAIWQTAQPSTPLAAPILPSHSAHLGVYDRRSLGLRR